MGFELNINKTLRTDGLKAKDMPAYLDSEDPVILTTSWRPLKGGGQSFKSHRLIQVDDNRLEFRRGLAPILIYSFVVLVGLFTISLAFISDSGNSNPLLTLALGILFVGIGIALFYFTNKKMVLDKNIMAFWRGKQDASKMINPQDTEGYCSLKTVHAVQLIKEYMDDTDGDDTYYSHELNLIFDNGKRINIVDHKDNQTITAQAEKVSAFLGVPLWDGRFDGVDGGMAKAHGILTRVLGWFKFVKLIGLLILVAVLINWMFFMKDPNPKTDLTTMSGIEREKLDTLYTKELFDLAKLSTVSLPLMNKLASTGINIDSIDEFGRTPLFYAVRAKNRDNMNFFMKRYANINIIDNEGIGLKDLLDIKIDKDLYFMIVDAELEEKANTRGKTVYQINRKFDKNGRVTSQEVLER